MGSLSLLSVAGNALGAPVADLAIVVKALGHFAVASYPVAPVAWWARATMTGKTGPGLVTGLAAFAVPAGRRAMHASPPQGAVIRRQAGQVAGLAGALLVTQRAVLSVLTMDSPARFTSMLAQPSAAVIRRFNFSLVATVTFAAIVFSDLDAVLVVAGSTARFAQDRLAGVKLLFGHVGVAVGAVKAAVCRVGKCGFETAVFGHLVGRRGVVAIRARLGLNGHLTRPLGVRLVAVVTAQLGIFLVQLVQWPWVISVGCERQPKYPQDPDARRQPGF